MNCSSRSLIRDVELERLALLLEELGYDRHAIGKILLYGYDSADSLGGPTTRALLETELSDVQYPVSPSCSADDISREAVDELRHHKAAIIAPYLHHQPGPHSRLPIPPAK